ncbi:phage tail protein [Pantoea sp. KXB25]|uniref:phage tail-collar fiber domain-containing protein n=1 Tax=unclassified Pantoea TaxID=2630326 RepID=UPI003AB8AAA5
MSQTVITTAFEQWKARQAETGEPVLLDGFIFANVPGLDPAKPVDRSEGIPPEAQIVHRQAVTRKGVVNQNAVVHSVVLGADTGDFSFNWIGLVNSATGTLAMIVHAPAQQKLKTRDGQQGNVLTRSFLMEYSGAQQETGISTPAETWQIDFTARMGAMDERQRLENTDIYGLAAFFGDGWLVGKSGTEFFVTRGAGYVGGLRAQLDADQAITVGVKPVKVWLDVCFTGTLASVWGVQSKITVATDLADYELDGVKHYVSALAGIDAAGNITDLRPKGSLTDRVAVRSVNNKKPDALTGNVMLGSAANADVMQSKTDGTAGRVITVGGFGLGSGQLDVSTIDFRTYVFHAGETLLIKMEGSANIPAQLPAGSGQYFYAHCTGVRDRSYGCSVIFTAYNSPAESYIGTRMDNSSSGWTIMRLADRSDFDNYAKLNGDSNKNFYVRNNGDGAAAVNNDRLSFVLGGFAYKGGDAGQHFSVSGGTGANSAVAFGQFQSGNNGNGAWSKIPGGGQWCRQNLNLAAYSSTTWTYPAGFPAPPGLFITAINGSFECWSNGIGANNCGIYNNGPALNVNVLALW